MGYYVHLHVSFNCSDNAPVAALAERYMGKVGDTDAERFLANLAQRTGSNNGPKGGLCLWGYIGNYVNAAGFVHDLIPFWQELYDVDCGLLSHHHIIVFYEEESSEQAKAFDIRLDEDTQNVAIERHYLPFAWHQA